MSGGFGLQGNFVEFEGNGRNDQITGNGDTGVKSRRHQRGRLNLQSGIRRRPVGRHRRDRLAA